MSTLGVAIPQSADAVAFWGLVLSDGATTVSNEAAYALTAGSPTTTYGPARVKTSARTPVVGPAAAQPTATNVGTDTSWSFVSQVWHIFIQNNTTANVQFAFEAASTAGSPIITPGATFSADLQVTAVHLLTAAAHNINGTAAANIVVWGWT